MTLLPVEPAWRLAERAEEHRWLVTGLWSEQAVGIVGGEPKCCKSFLALDLAVAVASGTPCLRRFAVSRAGRVLLFAAEDALHIVRRRLEGICAAAGLALADLDIQVITAPILRLDLDADRRNLADTVARLLPRLLILDPFVRLHRIDENASGEVAPLLAFLRELQRRHGTAVLVVHHARKGGGGVRAGQALRGSSEFHAWGDSNLYLRRNGDEIGLSVEHRAAPSPKPLTIELAQRGDALALEVADRGEPSRQHLNAQAFKGGSSGSRSQRLYSAREWERECGAHSAPQRLYTSLLPFWTELPWFGPSGASFIPATHPDRCRVEWRSRPAHLGRRRLGLDGREHGSTLDWHGAKQACQHQPSNDVADAPSMCVIVLIGGERRQA